MTEGEVTVCNRLGLHARAAARFVHLAASFRSRVTVGRRDAGNVDGKSILGLLTLAAGPGTRLLVVAEGDDERQAVDCLVELVRSCFGEEPPS